MRRLIKVTVDRLCWLAVLPAVGLCYLETLRGPGYERAFHACGQFFAVLPGYLGMCLRRAFYCGTLSDCSWDCQVGFGVIFSHREARVAPKAYIGNYALLGRVELDEGCLIGSRSSILSTGQHHVLDELGRWTTPDNLAFDITRVGAYAWIGEGAIVMAEVGEGALVAAGAVSGNKVPPHIMVAGNPARFVRKLIADEPATSAADEETSSAKQAVADTAVPG